MAPCRRATKRRVRSGLRCGSLALRCTSVAMRPFKRPRVDCWFASVAWAACRAAAAWCNAAWAWACAAWSWLCWSARWACATPRASMALAMSPLATDRYSLAALVCSPEPEEHRVHAAVGAARHVGADRCPAQAGAVRRDLRLVLGERRGDLGHLPVDLGDALLGGVVALRRHVEALLVGGQLGGDLRGLGAGARQGVGRGGARATPRGRREHCDDSSGQQSGIPPPLVVLVGRNRRGGLDVSHNGVTA